MTSALCGRRGATTAIALLSTETGGSSKKTKMTDLFEIVHEDEKLLVINKPAGLVCHPTKGDIYSSLISRVRVYLGSEIRVHLINRLDRETSGLVVLAKDDGEAALLRALWESGQVQKTYLALVEGDVESEFGLIDRPIGPHPSSKVVIRGGVRDDGAPSQTRYRRLHGFDRQASRYSLLLVQPATGRKHQIRIHLAHLGYPIVGDKIYGPNEEFYLAFVEGRLGAEAERRLALPNQALHALSLEWTVQGTRTVYVAEPEPAFVRFLREGVPAISLDRALKSAGLDGVLASRRLD